MSNSFTISALGYEGLTAVTADGEPAQIVIVDGGGAVVAAGKEIADAAWRVAINAYRQCLLGKGHLRVLTKVELGLRYRAATGADGECEDSMMESNHVTICARSWQGLSALTRDAKAAQFAVLDGDGALIAVGREVAKAAWEASVNAYRQFLTEGGHLRVWTREEAMAERRRWGFGDESESG